MIWYFHVETCFRMSKFLMYCNVLISYAWIIWLPQRASDCWAIVWSLPVALWISAAFCINMACMQYNRQELMDIGFNCRNVSYGDIALLRKSSTICNVATHHGVRGSGHRTPIQDLVLSRKYITHNSPGAYSSNLIYIKNDTTDWKTWCEIWIIKCSID